MPIEMLNRKPAPMLKAGKVLDTRGDNLFMSDAVKAKGLKIITKEDPL